MDTVENSPNKADPVSNDPDMDTESQELFINQGVGPSPFQPPVVLPQLIDHLSEVIFSGLKFRIMAVYTVVLQLIWNDQREAGGRFKELEMLKRHVESVAKELDFFQLTLMSISEDVGSLSSKSSKSDDSTGSSLIVDSVYQAEGIDFCIEQGLEMKSFVTRHEMNLKVNPNLGDGVDGVVKVTKLLTKLENLESGLKDIIRFAMDAKFPCTQLN